MPVALPFSAGVSVSPESVADRVRQLRSSLGNLACRMVPASELPERAASPVIATGIASVDVVAGGLPCGSVTEIYGPVSSGRTALLFATMAQLTRAGQVCALVDVTDSFDPVSAAAAGVELQKLLWVRCNGVLPQTQPATVTRYVENDFGVHEAVEVRTDAPLSPARAARKLAFRKLEQGLRAADLLLQAGGFSLIALDGADLAAEITRRVPLTTWYRFRRAVESTPTAFVVLDREAVATGCASLSLRMERTRARKSPRDGRPTHAALLEGMDVSVEMMRGTMKKRAQRADFGCRLPIASCQ